MTIQFPQYSKRPAHVEITIVGGISNSNFNKDFHAKAQRRAKGAKRLSRLSLCAFFHLLLRLCATPLNQDIKTRYAGIRLL
jgi:hypothetical protein